MTRAVVFVVLTATAAWGQGPDPVALKGQSDQTAKRFQEAERKLAEGKVPAAVEELQRLLDEAGDDLVPTDAARTQFRPARQVVQVVLAGLPADALRTYRDRADAAARKLLDEGKKARDPRPLKALLDRYSVSRPAEEALLLLGELAFERGDFRTAEGYWRRLIPGSAGERPFPDPRGDPAAVRAKVLLAVIYQGDLVRARTEFAKFQTDYPKATGRLAGRDGLYTETLKGLLDRPPVLAADRGDGTWTGFAGGPEHNGRVTGRLPRYWPGTPTWKATIPAEVEARRPGAARVGVGRAVSLHPVVLNGVAYVADATRVFGFDPRTGVEKFAYSLLADPDGVNLPGPPAGAPPADADYTLTAANGHLYARLGAAAVAPRPGDPRAVPLSYLVGFAPADNAPLAVKWKLAPPVPAGVAATWEGAPVWADGHLYAAFARFEQTRVTHAVACYPDHDPPGRPVWVAEVADGPQGDARARHEPVTVADGKVIFCTHTGIVVALDARTGKPAWAFRYPRPARSFPPGTHRDLCPPVAAGGRVFVAPADGDAVYALDAETGRELWRSATLPVEHIVGVAAGRLIVSVSGDTKGIRGLSVANGLHFDPDGWGIHDDPRLGAQGRGLVSDEFVLWPTREGLFFVNPVNGLQARLPLGRPNGRLPPVSVPAGNLAFADGVLLVATPTELWGYVADRVGLPMWKADAAARPDDPEAARRLALAYADAGLWLRAEEVIRRAEPAADPARVKAEWLADRAERAVIAGDIDFARELLRFGLDEEYPAAWRVRAAGRLLTLQPPGGGAAALGKFLAELGQAAGFDAGFVRGPDGIPVRLRDLAAKHFRVNTPSSAPEPKKPVPKLPAFDVLAQHTVGPTVAVRKQVTFPSGRFVPLLPVAGGDPGPRLFASDGRRLVMYPPNAERPAWAVRLPEGVAVTHVGLFGESVVAAGSGAAVRLKLADGARVWTFTLPDADRLVGVAARSAGAPDVLPGMSDFALAGNRLIARVGDHHLLALDTDTGNVAWAKDAMGRPRLDPYPVPSAPRFGRHFFADGQAIIVHVSTGRRTALDTATGDTARDAASALVPWDAAPVRLADKSVAVSDGGSLVRGLDVMANKTWEVDAGGEASLTGRPPTCRALPEGAVVAVSRNYGVEIQRVGKVVWRGGATVLPAGEIDLSAADVDAVHLYVPANAKLVALKLSDGQQAWQAALPGPGPWRVRAGRRTLVVLPAQPVATDAPGDVLGRQGRSFAAWPAGWRLPGLAVGVYDAWTDRAVPVLVLDPETGHLRQRLDLPAGPALVAHVGPDAAVVATTGTAYWLK